MTAESAEDESDSDEDETEEAEPKRNQNNANEPMDTAAVKYVFDVSGISDQNYGNGIMEWNY